MLTYLFINNCAFQISMDEINFFKVPEILIVVNGGLQHDNANKTLSILFRLHFIIKLFFKEKFCL